MTQTRWKLNRAGLINFWYYDYEILDFADGKLLLNGDNGSGKSVTMQSLITVLLDGSTQPARLDPFGTTSRRMNDYLLGEKEISQFDERTGYLFLEYTKPGTDLYITTGIGLQARRSTSLLGFWGFVLRSQRRVGIDFDLVKWEHSSQTGSRQPVPLSRRELENTIKPTEGSVVRSRKEYKALVNKHLFGFPNLNDYDDLIKLLLQLRSPKLSKAFKPSVIYEILHNALAPLSEEELRPLSDTLDNINQARLQLARLKNEREALINLRKPFNRYNRFILAEKAQALLDIRKKVAEHHNQLAQSKDKAQAQRQEQSQLKEASQKLQAELKVVEAEFIEYMDHDVFRAEKEKHAITNELNDQHRVDKLKDQDHERKSRQQNDLEKKRLLEQEEATQIKAVLLQILADMDVPAREAVFNQHTWEMDQLKSNLQSEQDFASWQKQSEQHRNHLREISKILKDLTRQKERHEDARLEVDRIDMELSGMRDQEQQQNRAFELAKTELAETFEDWLDEQEDLFRMEPAEIASTKRAIRDLYETSWSNAQAPAQDAIARAQEQLAHEEAALAQESKQLEADIDALKTEVESWRLQRDPEPPRHEDTVAARQLLQERKLKFLPFYHAVTFQDHLPDSTRERIEASLMEMGILDALITPANQHLAPQHDRILRALAACKGPSLADVLKPTPSAGLTEADITAILRGIPYDTENMPTDSIQMNGKGQFQIGPIRGHAPRHDAAVYIGKEARRRFRERRIAELETKLTQCYKQRQVLEKQRNEHRDIRSQLKAARQSFPSDRPVRIAFETLAKTRRSIESLDQQAERANQRFKDTLEQLRQLQEHARQKGKSFGLSLDSETFDKALLAMDIYLSKLATLSREHGQLCQRLQAIQTIISRIHELTTDLEQINHEREQIKQIITEKQLHLKAIEARLVEMGADEIRQKLAALRHRKEELPSQIQTNFDRLRRIEYELEQFESERATMEAQFDEYYNLFQNWYGIFLAELRLRLARPFDYESLPNKVWDMPFTDADFSERDSLHRAATIILNKFTELRKGDRTRYYNTLNEAFYRYRADLLEYDLQQVDHLASDLELRKKPERAAFGHEWERLETLKSRVNIKLLYDAQRRDLHDTLKTMETHIEEQELVLSERDRKLYQEVILNNIGTIITTRIHRTKEWVQHMNELMAERNISSGIVFSLDWLPKTADGDEELDTEELVKLLTMNRALLDESQLGRLTSHFQSHLDRARRASEDQGGVVVFHEEVKRVLDYRQWFRFKLSFRKPDKPKRELTDRAFGQFSGGEKAMAMYIPLFSATWSRYDVAASDAPRLISLDEAFAGVDENNIREMFDLMGQLDFDYLINSQVLWGDYDTVSQLSIVKLLRPRDANLVTPVRFLWNGKTIEDAESAPADLFEGLI